MAPLGSATVYLGTSSPIALQLIHDPDRGADPTDDPGYRAQWVTQDVTKTLTSRDVPDTTNRFTAGAGIIRRRDALDEGGYAWGENVFTHLENGVSLGPEHNVRSQDLGLSQTNMIITDSRPYAGDRYLITSGGCVIKVANDDPTGTISYSPALNAFGNATTSLHAGYVCTAIEVFADTAGNPSLFVYAYSSGANKTKVYKYQATTGTWTNTQEDAGVAEITTYRIDKAVAPVWWESSTTGTGAQRLIVSATDLSGGAPSSTGKISNVLLNCAFGSDPMEQASYVAPIRIDPQFPTQKLLAFPEFVFAVTASGVWTVNERRAMNLTPYALLGSSYASGQVATLYHGGVFWARGYGADWYDASVAFRRQDEPMEVGPSAYFQDGIPIRGQVTGATQYGKFLIQSLYNHQNQTTYVGRAIPRSVANVDGRGPWVQYWSEYVHGPAVNVGQQVTHQVISSPTVSASSVLASRDVYLWLFMADEPFTTGHYNLQYYKLPTGPGPISMEVSASGAYRYTTNGKLWHTNRTWGDEIATKYVRRFDLFGQRMSTTQTVAIYTRGDGDPTTTATFPGAWTLAGPLVGSAEAVHKIVPSSPVSAHALGLLSILTTNSATITPVLQGLSARAKVVRETYKTFTIYAQIERGAERANQTPEYRSPNAVVAAVEALQDVGQQTYVNENGDTWTVIVEQGIAHDRLILGDREYRDVLQIQMTRVA